MSLISSKFADELCEKEMRDAYLDEQTYAKIVEQIRVLRGQRGLSQADSAKMLGKPQSNVSQRLENRDYRGFKVNTLLEVAHAYDVGIVIEFVPYAEFIRRTNNLSRGALEVSSFDRQSLDALCGETSPQRWEDHHPQIADPQDTLQLLGKRPKAGPYTFVMANEMVLLGSNMGTLENVSAEVADVLSYYASPNLDRNCEVLADSLGIISRQGNLGGKSEISPIVLNPQLIDTGVVA